MVYKLTGELAVDHSSAGNIGGIYDLKERKWSSKMAEKLGIPLEFLPERLVECTEIVGKITEHQLFAVVLMLQWLQLVQEHLQKENMWL